LKERVDSTFEELNVACNNWFQNSLSDAMKLADLQPGGSWGLEKGEVGRRANEEWNKLTIEEKATHIRELEIITHEGQRRVFGKAGIQLQWIKRVVRAALAGGYMTNQGPGLLPLSWSSSGFGFWAHIVPDVAFHLIMGIEKDLNGLNFEIDRSTGPALPHLIYKQPYSKQGKLAAHHDQMAPRDLLSKLAEHNGASTEEWVHKYGFQMLTHLRGGLSEEDGATFAIAPMNPTRLKMCLTQIKEWQETPTSSFYIKEDNKRWINQPIGKVDLDWGKYMERLNSSVLAPKSEPFISIVPISPGSSDHAMHGFHVLFPVGFPHGAYGVDDKKAGRISVTLPIKIKTRAQSSNNNNNERVIPRLRNLAIVAHSEELTDEYKQAVKWIEEDTNAYHHGSTHSKPQSVLKLIQMPGGVFRKLIVKSETVKQYIDYLNDKSTSSQLALPVPQPVQPVQPAVMPHTMTTPPPQFVPYSLHQLKTKQRWWPGDIRETKILKIKQPWASLLVNGIKTVENRSWPLTANFSGIKVDERFGTDPGVFPVIVVSSKAKAKRIDIESAATRIRDDERIPLVQYEETLNTFTLNMPLDSVLGVIGVKVKEPVKEPVKTPVKTPTEAIESFVTDPWYNKGDYAYVVQSAHALKTPFQFYNTIQTMALLNKERNELVSKLYDGIFIRKRGSYERHG
tara:strand:- start:2407 stop:4446 length:2040 start_codon:yes stop_codon:yes gene_type:complete